MELLFSVFLGGITFCIDVNRSRTASLGSKQSISTVVLHHRHAENMLRTALMTSDKTNKFFLVTNCC